MADSDPDDPNDPQHTGTAGRPLRPFDGVHDIRDKALRHGHQPWCQSFYADPVNGEGYPCNCGKDQPTPPG